MIKPVNSCGSTAYEFSEQMFLDILHFLSNLEKYFYVEVFQMQNLTCRRRCIQKASDSTFYSVSSFSQEILKRRNVTLSTDIITREEMHF